VQQWQNICIAWLFTIVYTKSESKESIRNLWALYLANWIMEDNCYYTMDAKSGILHSCMPCMPSRFSDNCVVAEFWIFLGSSTLNWATVKRVAHFSSLCKAGWSLQLSTLWSFINSVTKVFNFQLSATVATITCAMHAWIMSVELLWYFLHLKDLISDRLLCCWSLVSEV